MPGTLYGYADVGRFGLGHGLLAWGRCAVWCEQTGAKMVAPRWLRLRMGSYLRRERDKRFYYRLFRTGRQIGGLRRISILALADKRSAQSQLPPPGFCPNRDTVVVFFNSPADNERKHFHEIVGASRVVREALIDMTRPRFLPPRQRGSHIAIHVRGGDFAVPSDISVLKSGRHNQRFPMMWYVDMLTGLRQRLGDTLPAIVYSDCPDAELSPLLKLEGVRRSRYHEAITDMLAISEASVLISSGSGFSRWGSYLGQVPRLCFPGQRAVRTLGPIVDGVDLEPECEVAADIPTQFCSHVIARTPATEVV